MCLLTIIGFVAASVAWSVHPLLGLIVGFLFIGGAGWNILGTAFGASFGRLTPTGRSAYGPQGKEFITAWEARRGPMRPGQRATQPPPGLFKSWLKESAVSGISADDWLERVAHVRPPSIRGSSIEERALASRRAADAGGGQRSPEFWCAAIADWMAEKGDSTAPVTWIKGHQVNGQGEGEDTLLALSESNLHLVVPPELVKFPLIPHPYSVGSVVPLARMTDWEVKPPEPNGARLMRILVLGEEATKLPSLDEAMATRDFLLLLIGIPAGAAGDAFARMLEDAIARVGAFSPATRQSHPLRRTEESE